MVRFLKILLIFIVALLFTGGALLALDETKETPPKEEVDAASAGTVPLTYNPRYNFTAFGIESLHPFDGCKYMKIHDALIKAKLRTEDNFLCPKEIERSQLELVHTSHYLNALKDSKTVARILEIPQVAVLPAEAVDWRVLRPMRYATGGTLLACRAALKHGIAINIGGGFHHADTNSGGGFCVYADVPLAIETLRREKALKTALIVDTDAHQGNGFANIVRTAQPDTHVLDFFDSSIYPFDFVEEDMSVPLERKTGWSEYSQELAKNLPVAIERFKPDLIVYNAGCDVLHDDPLSTLQLLPSDLKERDMFVIKTARKHNIPVAMVLAGGYSKQAAAAQGASIISIIEAFDKKPESDSSGSGLKDESKGRD